MKITQFQYDLIRACKSVCHSERAFPNVVNVVSSEYGWDELSTAGYIDCELICILLLEVSLDLSLIKLLQVGNPSQVWKCGYKDMSKTPLQLDSKNYWESFAHVLISHVSLTEVAKYENWNEFKHEKEK